MDLPHRSVIVPKSWGYEEHVVAAKRYGGKLLNIRENESCEFFHYHKKKDETFYLLTGMVVLYVFDLRENEMVPFDEDLVHRAELTPGTCFRLRPKVSHRFHALVDSVIIEFSTPDDPDDTFRMREWGSYRTGGEHEQDDSTHVLTVADIDGIVEITVKKIHQEFIDGRR